MTVSRRRPDPQESSGGLFESRHLPRRPAACSRASAPPPPPSTPAASSTPCSTSCRWSPSRSTAAASSWPSSRTSAPDLDILPSPSCRREGAQLNGHVERANRTARIEFWNQYAGDMTVADANARFDGYLDYYNNHRPHSVIGMATGLSRDTFSVLHTVSNLPRSPCLRTGTPPPHFSVLATRRSLSCQLDNISQRIGVSGTGPPREPAGWPRVAQRACASLRVRDDRGVCRKENGCGFSFALVGDGRRRCRTFFGCIGHLDGTGQGRARGRVGCGQRGEPG